MKLNKVFFALTMTMLVTILATAQVAEKTLVKSFNLQGKQVVELDLKGEVDVQQWNNPIMRVQFSVALENGTSSMLKSLVQVGRYNLSSKMNDDAMLVYAPGMEREVKVKGNKLEEKITYTVFVPDDVMVKIADTASSSTGKTIDSME